jgi:peptidoglycan/LPS O-acetylase OafA/YrhL
MRYPLLDPLRGVAAVWVLTSHLAYSSGSVPPPGYWLACMGYLGVPLFFVVSGYCLTAAARRAARHGEHPSRFLVRRAVRVYPPFWAAVGVAILIYAGLAATGPPDTPYEGYLQSAWRALDPAEWSGVLSLGAAFRPTGAMPWEKYAPFNLAFWTLGVEIQFYVVVGVALIARRLFYPLLAGVTVASLPFVFDPTAFVSGWFLPHWPFFALGIGLYAALERRWTANRVGRRAGAVAAVAGAVLLLDGLIRAPLPHLDYRGITAGELEFAVGTTVLLWAAWRPADPAPTHRGRLAGVLVYLGAVSYSLYLLHVPLMIAAGVAVGQFLAPGTVAAFAVTVVAVCVLCYPFHRWVERPCMSSPRKGSARP